VGCLTEYVYGHAEATRATSPLFHLVEISGEVAVQMVKSARAFTQTRHARGERVWDAMRERDAVRINEAVLTIIADGTEDGGAPQI
jgi:hypothetical protein